MTSDSREPDSHCTVFRATAQQRDIWDHQLDISASDPDPFIVHLGLGMPSVDEEALAAAFADLTRRHELLRTTFEIRDQRLYGLIWENGSVPFSVEKVPAGDLRARMVQIASEHFDLGAKVAWRARLLQTDDGSAHVLLLSIHHLVMDLHSFLVLLGELDALYTARLQKRPIDLPAPASFSAYAADQHLALTGGRATRVKEYWAKMLAEPLPPVPSAFKRLPTRKIHAGPPISFEFDVATTTRVVDYAHRHDTTTAAVLLACFGHSLHQVLSIGEMAFVVPVRPRDKPEWSGTLGCFMNEGIVRAKLDGGYRELLERIHHGLVSAKQNAELPYHIVGEMAYWVGFNSWQPRTPEAGQWVRLFMGLGNGRPLLGGVEVKPVFTSTGEDWEHLSLTIARIDGKGLCRLTYDQGLLEIAAAEQLGAALSDSLAAL